jgi:hypothetical protein
MSSVNVETINVALAKVEAANKISLDDVRSFLTETPQKLVSTLESICKLDSIDDKYTTLIAELPQLRSNANFLLETSILL